MPYRIEGVSFKDRGADHFAHQPFGQVPWLIDGDVSIFESGAILLHVAEQSEALMPTDSKGRGEVVQWLFAKLNSVEMAALPYSIFKFSGDEEQTAGRQALDGFLAARLGHMEQVLSDRKWLTGESSVADNLISDVWRLVDRFDGRAEYPACRAYVKRATVRPAFKLMPIRWSISQPRTDERRV